MADRHFDDGAELPVLLFLEADIARVDAVFGQRLGAGRMIGQQLVADIVEVADQRDIDAEPQQPFTNARNGGGRFIAVDRDAHQFGAGAMQGRDLRHRAINVGRIGVGHGLHHDRRAAADGHAADIDADRMPAGKRGGMKSGHRRQPFIGSFHPEVAKVAASVNCREGWVFTATEL